MQFVLFAFQVVKESAHAEEFLIAIENSPLLLWFKMRPGNIKRNSRLPGEALHLGGDRPMSGLGPGLDRSLVQSLCLIWNHQIQIEINRVAEALASRARAERVIKREQARLWLRVTNATGLALESLREPQLLGW